VVLNIASATFVSSVGVNPASSLGVDQYSLEVLKADEKFRTECQTYCT
jgi:hypothetical protein